MIKFQSFVCLTIFLLFTQIGLSQDKSDFRNVKWGMNRNTVSKTEKESPILELQNELHYKGQVAGFDTTYGYVFTNGKLTRGVYLLEVKHTNKYDYISDYDKIKNILTRKYGNPNKDQTMWFNDLYKDHVQDWGFAISLGHLKFKSDWDLDRTSISNFLYGENYKISHIIVYESKLHQDLIKEKEMKQEEEGL